MKKVAVLGSCVSRDTCEFLTNSTVSAYVARQSAIVALCPVGDRRFSALDLKSSFQVKMFEGDQQADGPMRIVDSEPDLILTDLADERRGVWRFPDDSYLTNSIEAYRTGVEQWAPELGARLIPFGSNEHFSLWAEGFDAQFTYLKEQGYADKLVFLDIEWAAALDGSPYPVGGVRQAVGRIARRTQRRGRNLLRSINNGQGIAKSIMTNTKIPETQAETFAREARWANSAMVRYADHIRGLAKNTITRKSNELRIDETHKWGPEPYHYRTQDYIAFAKDIELLNIGDDDG